MRYLNYSGLYKYSIIAEPAGCIVPNDKMGFQLGVGTFQVTINNGLQYRVTHQTGTPIPFRITRTKADAIPKERILFLSGCSFTYGMGVNDEESYPFLLQQYFPEWGIINGGVPAYGAIQALLLLEENINSDHPPDVFIYNYLDFHQYRNILSPSFQQHLYQESQVDEPNQTKGLIFPYGYIDSLGGLKIGYQEISSQNLFGKLRNISAIINQIEFFYNKYRDRHLHPKEVTEATLLEIKKRCEAANIDFILAILQEENLESWIIPFCEKSSINQVDLRLNYQDPSYLNLPHDGHPSAKGHQELAQKMKEYLLNKYGQE